MTTAGRLSRNTDDWRLTTDYCERSELMNIMVIVRPAPGWEKARFNMQTGEPEVSAGTAVGLTAWGEGTWVLNLSDRNALDLALALAESDENESRVTALATA